MADIKALARKAKEKLDSRNAMSEVDAISKAIKGAGITYPPDVRRLMSQVGRQYAGNKREAARLARKSVA